MVRATLFHADMRRQRDVGGKRDASEGAAEATSRRLRTAIPLACGDGRGRGGGRGQEHPGEKGELREAVTGLGRMDKRRGSADHVRRGERDLLDRPAVAIEGAEITGAERRGQGRGEEQGLWVARIMERDYAQGSRRLGRRGGHEVRPRVRAQDAPLLAPGPHSVGGGGVVLDVRGNGRTPAPRVGGRPRPLDDGAFLRPKVLF